MTPDLASALPENLRSSRTVQVMEASIARGRLAHGILLEADNLEPLRTVARALASVLLQVPAQDALEHADCFLLSPTGKSRQIRVGEDSDEPNTMRRLLRDLQQSSLLGGQKVGVILEADRMNANAANAFLKTLEEPPRETTPAAPDHPPLRPPAHHPQPLFSLPPACGDRPRTGSPAHRVARILHRLGTSPHPGHLVRT